MENPDADALQAADPNYYEVIRDQSKASSNAASIKKVSPTHTTKSSRDDDIVAKRVSIDGVRESITSTGLDTSRLLRRLSVAKSRKSIVAPILSKTPKLPPADLDQVPIAQLMQMVIEHIEKRTKKVNVTRKLLIVALVVSQLLAVALIILCYFVVTDTEQVALHPFTTNELCQASVSPCAFFDWSFDNALLRNCSKIRCRQECYYPDENFQIIDLQSPTNGTTVEITVKDGMICGTNEICEGGICKAFKVEATVGKSTRRKLDCVEWLYGYGRCFDTDRCIGKGYYQVRSQQGLGFKLNCSVRTNGTCRTGQPVICEPNCPRIMLAINASQWAISKDSKCAYAPTGPCRYKCSRTATNDRHLPDGSLCHSGSGGYCWKGVCHQKDKFVRFPAI